MISKASTSPASPAKSMGQKSRNVRQLGSQPNPMKQIQKNPDMRINLAVSIFINGYGSKPWHLVNPKVAGKWVFIPLKLIVIGFDPIPY